MKYMFAFFFMLLDTMGIFADDSGRSDVLRIATGAGPVVFETRNTFPNAGRPHTGSASPFSQRGNSISERASRPRKEGRENIFNENWGPKARMLGQAAQAASDMLDNAKAWTAGLAPIRLALVIAIGVILLLGSFWAFFSYLPTRGIPSGVTGGVLTTSVVAGLAFTGWLAFHASGVVGEYLATAIMCLMGVSGALALLGGVVCGKGPICKLVAPVLMLVVSFVVFFLSMAAFLFVIVIVFTVFAFDFLRKAAFGGND